MEEYVTHSSNAQEYIMKLNKYNKYIENNMFILDVEKLCGYSEFVMVYKNSTIADVCNSIFQHFECYNNETKRLFVRKTQPTCTSHSACAHSDNIRIPMDISEDCIVLTESPELFRDIVKNNSEYFRLIYDLPCKSVYKIYLDEGHVTNNNV
jgi:hypothetical protein